MNENGIQEDEPRGCEWSAAPGTVRMKGDNRLRTLLPIHYRICIFMIESLQTFEKVACDTTKKGWIHTEAREK